MRTKQTDTAAMTEEQLDAVAGGAPHYTDFGGRRFQNYVSISPVPTPIPGVRLVSAEPLPSPHPRPWQTRIGSR